MSDLKKLDAYGRGRWNAAIRACIRRLETRASRLRQEGTGQDEVAGELERQALAMSWMLEGES